MTGSLQIKKGYYYVVLNYKSKNGIHMTKWVATGYEAKNNKRKAEALIEQYIESNQRLEHADIVTDKILFTDAMEDWLARVVNKVERSTYEGYITYVRKHLIPYFKKLRLYIHEVMPKHIMNYYEYKYSGGRLDNKPGGLDIQSIKKHSGVLKLILTDALIAEQIPRNPAMNVPMPKHERVANKGIFLTNEEANKLLQAFAGHELQAMVYITLYYGLRRSEVLGLRWSAIDFEIGTITIEHTVVKNLTVQYKDSTKTETSHGSFPLLSDVKDILLKLRERQAENRRILGNTYIESDYIFVWEDGKPYRPDYITRSFQRMLRNHGLPKMRYHAAYGFAPSSGTTTETVYEYEYPWDDWIHMPSYSARVKPDGTIEIEVDGAQKEYITLGYFTVFVNGKFLDSRIENPCRITALRNGENATFLRTEGELGGVKYDLKINLSGEGLDTEIELDYKQGCNFGPNIADFESNPRRTHYFQHEKKFCINWCFNQTPSRILYASPFLIWPADIDTRSIESLNAMAVECDGYGIAHLNMGQFGYGYRCEDSSCAHVLAFAPNDYIYGKPEQLLLTGSHIHRCRFIPYAGDWRKMKLPLRTSEFQHPVFTAYGEIIKDSAVSEPKSLLSVDSNSTISTALFERKGHVYLRLWEWSGQEDRVNININRNSSVVLSWAG